MDPARRSRSRPSIFNLCHRAHGVRAGGHRGRIQERVTRDPSCSPARSQRKPAPPNSSAPGSERRGRAVGEGKDVCGFCHGRGLRRNSTRSSSQFELKGIAPEFGVRSLEFRVQSSEFGVRSSEFGVRSLASMVSGLAVLLVFSVAIFFRKSGVFRLRAVFPSNPFSRKKAHPPSTFAEPTADRKGAKQTFNAACIPRAARVKIQGPRSRESPRPRFKSGDRRIVFATFAPFCG